MRIAVYAFSSTALFFRALIKACDDDDVEWSAIIPQWHFRELLAQVIPADRCCYLYERFTATYARMGAAEIAAALACGEGLITALLKDKDGYRRLDKEEQLRRGAAINETYREFLVRVRPDYVLFPDVEAVDGFVLVNLCRSLGIDILYYTSMRILQRAFFGHDPYESLPAYFGEHTEADLVAARSQIRNFGERRALGPGSRYPAAAIRKPPFLRRVIVGELMRRRFERLHASEDSLTLRIKRNVRPALNRARRLHFDARHARFFDVHGRADALPERFVLYALQYTPESSINGLEPYYVDQTRVIDALLLCLPVGHRLLVKEHPAMYGVRSAAFYRRLRRRPGLTLAHPSLDTRELMQRASLTVTVTGTIGLECFLLGRPCLIFGRNFFRHLCFAAPAVSELREFVDRIIATYVPPTAEEGEVAIAKFWNIGGDFLIADPWFNPSVMSAENIAATREYLLRHIDRLRAARPAAVAVERGNMLG
jgi:hypothetical protein